MPSKKNNHNHIEDLGCVPETLLERNHKTLMVSLNSISPSMHFIIDNRTMKHIYQSTQIFSNIGVVLSDNHVYKIQKVGVRGRTWIAYITRNSLPQGIGGLYNK